MNATYCKHFGNHIRFIETTSVCSLALITLQMIRRTGTEMGHWCHGQGKAVKIGVKPKKNRRDFRIAVGPLITV